MVYKGLVLEVKEKYSVVQSKEMGLTKIKTKEQLKVGMEIFFLDEDLYKKESFIKPYYFMAAAVLFLALIVSGTNINGKDMNSGVDTPNTYSFAALVSIDINPSLELELDDEMVVKGVRYVNDDAKKLVNERMLVGKYYTLAVKDVITMAKEKGYIVDNGSVMISSSSADKEKKYEVNINKQIEEVFAEEENINLLIINTDENTLEKSRENNVSIGKYALYKNLNEKESDEENKIELETIKKMKVSEIVKEGIAKRPESKIKLKKAKDKKDNEDDDIDDSDIKEDIDNNAVIKDEQNIFVVIKGVEYISLDTIDDIGLLVNETGENGKVNISNKSESVVFEYDKPILIYEEDEYVELKEVLKALDIKYHYAGDKIKIQGSDIKIFLYYGNPGNNKDKLVKENEKKKEKEKDEDLNDDEIYKEDDDSIDDQNHDNDNKDKNKGHEKNKEKKGNKDKSDNDDTGNEEDDSDDENE